MGRLAACLVPGIGLEPIRVSPHAPQTCASAYSATRAYRSLPPRSYHHRRLFVNRPRVCRGGIRRNLSERPKWWRKRFMIGLRGPGRGGVTGAVLAVVLVLTGQVPAAAAELETVRLSEVVRSVFYAPQYVALEKGFFADEGLAIELSTAWGAHNGMAALISGSVDIGFFGPEATIYVYNQGAPDRAVGFAQLTQRDGSFFMARGKVENFEWDDVRGRLIVGARKGGVPQMVLE